MGCGCGRGRGVRRVMGASLVILALMTLSSASPAAVNGYSMSQSQSHSHSHSHSHGQAEREHDGASPRDADHYREGVHYSEFDHEAILGSSKEAEEFDHLPIGESKRRLGILLLKMDLNGDKYIDKDELKAWIMKSFAKLSEEEASERFEEVDSDQNGTVSWSEYISETYGIESEYRIPFDENNSFEPMMMEDKIMFDAADEDNDGILSFEEFVVFSNPEEHPQMHAILLKQTLKEKDTNNDGKIDFQEFVGERGFEQDKEWITVEKDKFDNEFDLNHDGILAGKEIESWIIPNNEDIAEDETEHLFASSDDDHDLRLTFEEIIDHHDIFVGSEATDYGDHLLGSHFEDEL
ncbi:reticulocalbin-2 [Arctopsyche grandis]|uniref:reticulocalbin-2 n=1 Tax=Arctopsyche grandis TaxID=121162 RepID=UPI00406D84C3